MTSSRLRWNRNYNFCSQIGEKIKSNHTNENSIRANKSAAHAMRVERRSLRTVIRPHTIASHHAATAQRPVAAPPPPPVLHTRATVNGRMD
jgi:hypothetical protein